MIRLVPSQVGAFDIRLVTTFQTEPPFLPPHRYLRLGRKTWLPYWTGRAKYGGAVQ